jgi:di/tricarboxylate transporter
MTFEAWLTLGVIAAAFSGLLFTRISADILMMAALTILLVGGVLTTQEALSGFANEGLMTVAALYVVANGLYETGVVNSISTYLMGKPTSANQARFRLMSPVALLSAFMNNTPVVAMFLPMVSGWAKRHNVQASQLMIPLSYAAMIGGTCTLIGTSTNLILNSMLQEHNPTAGLGMFDLAWVGVPSVLVVIGAFTVFGSWLLPAKHEKDVDSDGLRRYSVEMLVEQSSVLHGQTIEQAGLRSLPNMYLVSIERSGKVMPAVGPDEVLMSEDRLMFAGEVESVVELNKMRGLSVVDEEERYFLEKNLSRSLVEVVVSRTCPLLSKTIKQARFRSHYNAAIIAVSRHGSHVRQKIGDIKLEVGDTLLLDAPDNFLEQQRYSKDFLLVSSIENSQAHRHKHSYAALSVLIAMVLAVSMQWLDMLHAALIAAGAMLATRSTTASIARRSIDWPVLIVIGASIALGVAVEKTGLASMAADDFILAGSENATVALFKLFILAAFFSSILSNMTAAVLLFPVAIAVSQALGVSEVPFVVTIMVAASVSFATPIGYQTNLMVYGPGGYRFSDYLRAGVPLVLLVCGISMLIIPWVWL